MGPSPYLGPVDHPYRTFLERLTKPARYLGAEYGAIRKENGGIRSRFCLAFPDLYELGMSHLGLKILYEIINGEPDLACERVFSPWFDLEEELRQRRLPLVSLETWRPLREFDVVGFSLQFELTATTVLQMLDLGEIPLRATQRGEADPLVIGGGPVAAHPEPLAPFFDLFFIGDAERALPALLRAEAELREQGADRPTRLAELAGRAGVYVPALAAVHEDLPSGRLVVGDGSALASRVWEPDLAELVDTGGGPVPSVEATFDRAAIEISRGCHQGCRFCQAGYLYRPLRERSADQVLGALERRSQEGGYDEVSLTALSTADYSALPVLLRGAAPRLAARDVSLSVSSLRAVGLDEPLLDDLRTGRAGGLTFAPEAGSQTLRDRIGKRISEEGLLQTARAVVRRGWNHLKLYFMIGLPHETDEDVQAIAALAEKVRRATREVGGRRPARLACAVNNFVPKPHTPMQWCAMTNGEELQRRQRRLRSETPRAIELRLHHVHMSQLEGILSRGDRRLADVIETAFREGARYDSWEERFDWPAWQTGFTWAGLDPETYLGALPVGGRLPWDHIDPGVTAAFLAKEHTRFEQGRPGHACDGDAVCFQCGLPCESAPPPRAAHLLQPDRPAEPVLPVDSEQVIRVRLRLTYAKSGPAAFLGHLDLVRHLPRVLRRAGLRPAYTRGYNPRPRLQFAPPLPLGAEGRAERCEARLVISGERPPAGTLLQRLAEATLPGLSFGAARWLGDDEPVLSKLCHGADFQWTFQEPPDREEMSARLLALRERSHWPVQRSRKKHRAAPAREVDLRDSLRSIDLKDEEGLGVALLFSLVQTPAGALRPREVVSAVAGEEEPEGRLVRLDHFTLDAQGQRQGIP